MTWYNEQYLRNRSEEDLLVQLKPDFEKAGYVDINSGSYSNHYSLRYLLQLFPFFRKYREKVLSSRFGSYLGNFKVIIPLGNMWVSGSKP